jgi:uncharacterized protein
MMKTALDAGRKRELDAEVRRRINGIEQLVGKETSAHGARVGHATKSVRVAGTDPFASCVDRRAFLRGGAALIGGAAIAGSLQMFAARRAHAQGWSALLCVTCPYGDPVPTRDEVTGLPLIGLPPGFRYWSHGWSGDPLLASELHVPTPPLHDGMAVLRQIGSLAILCRNHEAGVGSSFIGGELEFSPAAAGGNTNMIFDTLRKRWFVDWPTLSGTVRNCAGGITPHATWLSCEESLVTTSSGNQTFRHGWVFEVPALGVSNAEPIRAMGRFNHEALAVDPRTGIVYLTEDGGPGGVYRFLPVWPSHYEWGGRLEMLKVVGMPQVNLRGLRPVGGGGAPYPVPIGVPLEVEWVPIADPENLNRAPLPRALPRAAQISGGRRAPGMGMTTSTSCRPMGARAAMGWCSASIRDSRP